MIPSRMNVEVNSRSVVVVEVRRGAVLLIIRVWEGKGEGRRGRGRGGEGVKKWK
jgi:hypothetical protein